MKKATVQISFDASKLAAIRQYMGKRDSQLEPELADAIQKIYEKTVPAPVREYIEAVAAEDTPPRPARTNRPRPPAQAQESGSGNT